MVATVLPAASDRAIVVYARREDRVVVIEDKDFGVLAYRDGFFPPAVIRLALPRLLPHEKALRVVQFVQNSASDITGSFHTIELKRTRRRSL
jgi:predicted nuclease of predicted toxin-antitoxin system